MKVWEYAMNLESSAPAAVDERATWDTVVSENVVKCSAATRPLQTPVHPPKPRYTTAYAVGRRQGVFGRGVSCQARVGPHEGPEVTLSPGGSSNNQEGSNGHY